MAEAIFWIYIGGCLIAIPVILYAEYRRDKNYKKRNDRRGGER